MIACIVWLLMLLPWLMSVEYVDCSCTNLQMLIGPAITQTHPYIAVSQAKQQQDQLLAALKEPMGLYKGKPLAALVVFRACLHWKVFGAVITDVFNRIEQVRNQGLLEPIVPWDVCHDIRLQFESAACQLAFCSLHVCLWLCVPEISALSLCLPSSSK